MVSQALKSALHQIEKRCNGWGNNSFSRFISSSQKLFTLTSPKRNFGFASIFGFALILMATWEAVLVTVAFGLGNGGPSGLLYTYIGTWIGFSLVAISMAEMASMAPYVRHQIQARSHIVRDANAT